MKSKIFQRVVLITLLVLMVLQANRADSDRWLAAASRWILLDETVATSDERHARSLRNWAEGANVQLDETREGSTIRFHKK